MWLAILASGAATVGTNVHLPSADGLELAASLGGAWIRIDLNWDLAEPAQGQWNWAPFDAAIDAAKARGLKVYATLGYTPAWASSGNRDGGGFHNDVPVGTTYRTFVEAAVARYHTRIDVFGTWNEPNLARFFEGTRQEWIDVVYRPAVQGIRATCATCVVAGPELATVGGAYDTYLAAALAAAPPDVIAAHIYADFPEDTPGAGVTSDSFYNKLEQRRMIGPWSGTPSLRETAIAAGFGHLPMWITETGMEAVPGNANQLAAQRQFVQRVLDAMDTRPWWGGTLFYELTEEHPGGAWPDIHWGLALRTHDPDATPGDNFAPKPAFTYLQTRLAMTPPAAVDAGVVDAASGDAAGVLPGPDAGDGGELDAPPVGCGCASGDPAGVLLALAGLGLRRRPRIPSADRDRRGP